MKSDLVSSTFVKGIDFRRQKNKHNKLLLFNDQEYHHESNCNYFWPIRKVFLPEWWWRKTHPRWVKIDKRLDNTPLPPPNSRLDHYCYHYFCSLYLNSKLNNLHIFSPFPAPIFIRLGHEMRDFGTVNLVPPIPLWHPISLSLPATPSGGLRLSPRFEREAH